jgi:hypothetical protein
MLRLHRNRLVTRDPKQTRHGKQRSTRASHSTIRSDSWSASWKLTFSALKHLPMLPVPCRLPDGGSRAIHGADSARHYCDEFGQHHRCGAPHLKAVDLEVRHSHHIVRRA